MNTQMPLGTAIGRLNTLQGLVQCGVATEEIRAEYRMILDALNSFTIDLNMVCDISAPKPVSDIDIFKVSAKTGCCRITHDVPKIEAPKKRGSSRRS